MSCFNRIICRSLRIAAGLLAFVGIANAQGNGREVLTNQSVVTLANAGFDEEFLIQTIAMTPSHFDVNVEGLASLAKQGIKPRIIRAMMTASSPPEQSITPAITVTEQNVRPQTAPPGRRSAEPKPATAQSSAVALAMASRIPYYESHTMLWGLIKTEVGVGVAPRPQDEVTSHLGGRNVVRP